MDCWLIYFEDDEMRPEVFTGDGAESAARKRFAALDQAWNVILFKALPAPPQEDPKCD